MKRLFNLFTITLCVIGLVSCGGPSKRDVTVTDVEIVGFIKDYLKVVDGTYTFTNDGDDAFITIKLELFNKPNSIPERKAFASIRLNPIGEIGNVFDTGSYGFRADDSEFDKIEDLLKADIGKVKSITFKWDYYGVDDKIGKQIFKEATSFELIDNGFDTSSDNSNVSSFSNDESSKMTKSSNDWDKVLDEYEKYVDKYISYVKKAANGDMSAFSDMSSLMDSAEEFGDKLENAEGELTSKQLSRYTKITTKFTEAMADLSR